MEPFRNGIPEMFDAALEMGIRFFGAPYLFSSADPKADNSGVVQYAAATPGRRRRRRRSGTLERALRRLAWARLGPHPARYEPACDGHVRARTAAGCCRASPRTGCADHDAFSPEPERSRNDRRPDTVAARRPEYLEWLGLLAPDLLAAHCIASTDADLGLMKARGATVLNCPRVFARAGTTAAFSRFAAHGVRTLVGTDGYNMDLLGELNAAAMISKVTSGSADVANAPELVDAVTKSAADSIRRPGPRRDQTRRRRGPHGRRSHTPAPAAAFSIRDAR